MSGASFGRRGPRGKSGTGVAGTNGNTILTTSGAPSNGTGANGDYAYDPTAKIMYGPKAAGVWPAGVSLQGPSSVDSVNPPPSLLDWIANGQTTAAERFSAGNTYTVGSEWAIRQRIRGVIRRVVGLKARLINSGNETHDLSLWNFAGTLHETKSVVVTSTGEWTVTFDVPFQPLLNATFLIGMCNRTNTAYNRISAASSNRDYVTTIVSGGVQLVNAGRYVLGTNTRPTNTGSERFPIECVFEEL